MFPRTWTIRQSDKMENAGKTQNRLGCVYEENRRPVSFDRKCVAAHAIT